MSWDGVCEWDGADELLRQILINNAGILRDKSFKAMTDKEWDAIEQVHVKGAYACTKAAWPIMRKQKYGRIINVSTILASSPLLI